MNTFGICTILYLVIISVIDDCNAECDEYMVVLEETFCPSSKFSYRIRPLTQLEINWSNVTYPCNSTEKDLEKKKCLAEFDCMGTHLDCPRHIKQVHHETHHDIADPLTAKPITIRTEAPDVTTNRIPVTKKPTVASDVTTSNIPVTEKPVCTVCEEFKASMYDVNLIYINENRYQNNSETTNQTPRNETLYCHYAEIICFAEINTENNSLGDDKNVTYHEETAATLELSINRDETSPVQPIFTGYFPESSNEGSTNYNGNFKYLKSISQTCPILKQNNCKQNIQLNLYIKANYIQNNTMTKYPNCTKQSITSVNVIHVECKDISFVEHNRHIEYTPPNPSPKQEMLTCHILSSKDQRSEHNQLNFINCSNETNISNNTIISGESNITAILDTNSKKNTEISTAKENFKKDNSSHIEPDNIIIMLVTENTNNCSRDKSLNIDEGKIIDLDVDNKEKIKQFNNIELLLSNCIHENSSIIINKQPTSKAELIIILKSESLNASNLEKFNGTEEKSVKQRILLRCDHPNHYASSNATNDKTTLQCDSIELEVYNITGIEVTPLSQISNSKTAIKSENKTVQELLTWNCNILEIIDTSKEHQENKLYFENCSNNVNINNSTNKSGENNVTSISYGDNKNIDVTKTKDDNEIFDTENPSGKIELNKDNLSQTNLKNKIKILITEKSNNCSNHSYFMIDEGKIIDLDVNKNKENILQNNIIELELSSCINADSPITKEIKPDSKVELTIILNSESLNTSNLKQFNGTHKDEIDKQRILLRCDHNHVSSNATSNKTIIKCEPIDLVLNNITGVEISTNVNRTSNTYTNKELEKENFNMVEGIGNHTKVNVEIQKKSKLNTNKTVENNATINKKNHEDTKVVESKEVQEIDSKTKESHFDNNKKTDENKKVQKISINQMFNRKKDINNGSGHNSLGQNSLALRPTERETILIIALLSIICSCILMVIAWRLWPKKTEYNPAPTREPPDEETAF